MTRVRTFGALLTGGAGLAAWLSLAGALVPVFDVLASFLPLFGIVILLGLLIARRRRGWTIAAALLCLAPVVIGMAPELTRAIPAATKGGAVHVLTHNVWRDNSDPADTAQAIVDARPDVVLLQEVSGNFRPMLAALRQHFAYATRCPPGCDLASSRAGRSPTAIIF